MHFKRKSKLIKKLKKLLLNSRYSSKRITHNSDHTKLTYTCNTKKSALHCKKYTFKPSKSPK